MSLQTLARAAYASPSSATRTARDIEYDAFARATHRLRAALATPDDHPVLVRALHENRALWSVIATEVADPANGLPAPLRAQLFYLAEFTARHSSRVLAGEAGAEALVDINMAVMRGLRGEEGRA